MWPDRKQTRSNQISRYKIQIIWGHVQVRFLRNWSFMLIPIVTHTSIYKCKDNRRQEKQKENVKMEFLFFVRIAVQTHTWSLSISVNCCLFLLLGAFWCKAFAWSHRCLLPVSCMIKTGNITGNPGSNISSDYTTCFANSSLEAQWSNFLSSSAVELQHILFKASALTWAGLSVNPFKYTAPQA